jgi:tyrosine-protein kinase Etk/Wzc
MEWSQLLRRIRDNWYWFLLFGLIGLVAGWVYNQSTSQAYEATSTILIRTEGKNETLKSLYKDLGIPEKTTTIQNQIGVLSSYNLNLKTVLKLNWDETWYLNSFFNKTEIYSAPPFDVEKPDYFEQAKNIAIGIKPVSEDSYQISYDDEAIVHGFKTSIKFKGVAKFGDAFVNENFNFKLNKFKNRPVLVGTEYLLVFNDVNQMASAFQSSTDVKMVDKDADLVTVKFQGNDLVRTVDYLNGLTDEYIAFGLQEKDKLADNTMIFIDSLVESIDSSLQVAGNQYTDFRTQNRVVDIDKESSLVIEKSKNIEDQEAQAKIKLDYYNSLKTYLKNPNKIKNLVAPSIVGVTDPTLNGLVQKLSDLSSQREVESYTLQEKNPKLIALDKEIAYTQNELAENINNLSSNTKMELNNLTSQKNVIYQQQSTLPKKEQNYINIKRSVDLNSDLYNFLLQRKAEAGIMKASNAPGAQIIDPARIDTSKSIGHHGPINLVIGFIMGVILTFLYYLLKNYTDNTIQDISEVGNSLDVPITSIIRRNVSQSELPAFENPESEVAESFRNLRLKLYFSGENGSGGKIVSVNSNTSEEGKSFVSSNLAAILSVDNKNVLLIDSDLRKPDIQNVFHVENRKGLTSYLNNEAGFDEVLSKTDIPNLTVLTTGPATNRPSELLNNGKMKLFLDQARKRFDFVIIKNPPSGLISDALLVQKFSDINIYLLKFKFSTNDHVQYINDISRIAKPENMMVVLNNVTESNGQAYGYYK